jgi:hypothetical protein
MTTLEGNWWTIAIRGALGICFGGILQLTIPSSVSALADEVIEQADRLRNGQRPRLLWAPRRPHSTSRSELEPLQCRSFESVADRLVSTQAVCGNCACPSGFCGVRDLYRAVVKGGCAPRRFLKLGLTELDRGNGCFGLTSGDALLCHDNRSLERRYGDALSILFVTTNSRLGRYFPSPPT